MRGVSNKHCLLTFFFVLVLSIFLLVLHDYSLFCNVMDYITITCYYKIHDYRLLYD